MGGRLRRRLLSILNDEVPYVEVALLVCWSIPTRLTSRHAGYPNGLGVQNYIMHVCLYCKYASQRQLIGLKAHSGK
jgi:hypothetical protein